MSANMDVYDELWDNNKDIAEETLHVPFLEHMQMGNLQADYYVGFQIQDINYLLKVTDMLEKMCQKDAPEDIKEFMETSFKDYKRYSVETLKQFNLTGVSDIIPTPAMEKYLSDYGVIMENEESIYFAVALLPCSRLWKWLAWHLKESYGNAYFTWKKENMHGHPEEHYKALLNKYLTTPAQIERANVIFRQQMQNEHDFFATSLVE